MNIVNIVVNVLILIVAFFLYRYFFNRGYQPHNKKESKKITKIKKLYKKATYEKLISKLNALNMSFERYIAIKVIAIVAIVVLYVLITLTNYSMTKNYVGSIYDYTNDSIYVEQELPDEEIQKIILKKEMDVVQKMMRDMSYSSFTSLPKDSVIEIIYYDYLYEVDWEIHRDISSHRIYYRLDDLFSARKVSLALITVLSALAWFGINVVVDFLAKHHLRNKVRELDFLKELVIINGQIKPVSINTILELLAKEATYNKRELREIFESYNSLNNDVRVAFGKIYKSSQHSDLTVFYENLERATLFNIDDAIRNFQDDAYNSKEIRKMEIDTTSEQIEAVGMLMFMLLMVALIAYSVMPWLSMVGSF